MKYTDSYDLECLEDLDPDGREVSGGAVVIQEIWHRLCTREGMAIDAPGEGIDVLDSLHGTDSLRDLQAKIRNEVIKDERISKCIVQAIEPDQLVIDITASGEDLTMTLSISDLTVQLLGVKQ